MNESAMNLERFLTAQAPVMADVMAELQAGRKQSHWMWFVFPQLAALGRSATAKFYGLRDLAEAKAYLAHPVLGARLVDCTRAVLAHAGKKTAHEIFGAPDDLKFRSCMTLFMLAAPQLDVFRSALDAFYAGEADENTVRQVGADR
ncbi:MAG: DUF1810 domain-containing protein [Burkholderiaceae bacterium]